MSVPTPAFLSVKLSTNATSETTVTSPVVSTTVRISIPTVEIIAIDLGTIS